MGGYIFDGIIILIATLIVKIRTVNAYQRSCIFFMNRGDSTFCCHPLLVNVYITSQ